LSANAIVVRHKEDVTVAPRNVSSPDMAKKDDGREKAISLLQAAIVEGLESGEPQKLDVETFKLRMRRA
tara:strand:+ start:79 stop:285 length:207 start_codon:yes stop_codon:yes gene_type:complete